MTTRTHSIALLTVACGLILIGCGDGVRSTENYVVPLAEGCGEFVPNSYIVHYAPLLEHDEWDDVDEYPDSPDWQELELTEAEEMAAINDISVATTEEMDFIEANGGTVEDVLSPESLAFSAIIPDEVLGKLRQNPLISTIERNCVAYGSTTQQNAPWGLDRIDERARPTDGSYHYIHDGRNVDVYVIDTGVLREHEEFDGRVRYLFSHRGNAGGYAETHHWHGTHVAGTIAGQTYGVAKRARIQSMRVLDKDGMGTAASVVKALNTAIRHHRHVRRPAVANMSLGFNGIDKSVDAAVREAVRAGITVVVAAGNDRQNACDVSPARVGTAITVGATRNDDRATHFSNWGNCMDIYAPGQGIRSAGNGSNHAALVADGTSMAAPHVAGVIANYLQTHRRASPIGATKWLMEQATTNVVWGAHENGDTRFLFAGRGIVATGAGSSSPGELLVAQDGECGITPKVIFAEVPFVMEPRPAGYKVVLSSTPDGSGNIAIDDAMTIECNELASNGMAIPGTTKWFYQNFHAGACVKVMSAPAADISDLLSDYHRVGCQVTLRDECGVCIGNTDLYLSYLPL